MKKVYLATVAIIALAVAVAAIYANSNRQEEVVFIGGPEKTTSESVKKDESDTALQETASKKAEEESDITASDIFEPSSNVMKNSFAVGTNNMFYIKDDNTLWAYGRGELGDGKFTGFRGPVKILDNVYYVSSIHRINTGYSMAIKNDCTLWIWGENEIGIFNDGKFNKYGEVKIDSETKSRSVTQIENHDCSHPAKVMDDVIQAEASYSYVYALKSDGTLVFFGGGNGRAGDYYHEPVAETIAAENVKKFATVQDGGHLYVIKNDNSVWQISFMEGEEDKLIANDVKDLFVSYDAVYMLKDEGTFWGMGSPKGDGFLVDTFQDGNKEPIYLSNDITDISIYSHERYYISKNNELFFWGTESGNGAETAKNIDRSIKLLDDVASVGTGAWISAAVTKSGELYTWGYDFTEGKSLKDSTPVKLADGIRVNQ